MTAQDELKTLVSSDLQPLLKAHGFGKKGLTFYRRNPGNFGLVQLQKSRYSTSSEVTFTINVGVFSDHLQRELGKIWWVPEVGKIPTEPSCHVRKRIGLLMPEANDVWWTVKSDAPSALGAELCRVVQTYALPFLDARATDEALRDRWIDDGTTGGISELQLAVLLRDLGPRDRLEPLLTHLRATTPPRATLLRSALDRFAESLD